MVTMKIEGAKKAYRKLAQLQPNIQKRVSRASLRKAANVIMKDVRASAPTDTGAMKRSIKTKNVRVPFPANRTIIKMKVATPTLETAQGQKLSSESKSGRRYLYPVAHELGTAQTREKHFMYIAAQRRFSQAVAMYVVALRTEIARQAVSG